MEKHQLQPILHHPSTPRYPGDLDAARCGSDEHGEEVIPPMRSPIIIQPVTCTQVGVRVDRPPAAQGLVGGGRCLCGAGCPTAAGALRELPAGMSQDTVLSQLLPTAWAAPAWQPEPVLAGA